MAVATVVVLAVSPSRRLAAQDSVIVLDPDAPAIPGQARSGLSPAVLQELLLRYNAPHTTRVEGPITVAAESELQVSLGVWQGPLRVAGLLVGPVTVVNGDLEILSGGRIRGQILVVGGRLIGDTANMSMGLVRVFSDAAPVVRLADGTLEVRDRRRPILDFGGAQRSFRTGKVVTSLFFSSGGTYNRVEGLPVTLGPRFRYESAPGRRLSLDLFGVVRTAGDPTALGEDVGYETQFDYQHGVSMHHGWGLGVRAAQVVDAIEPQPLFRSEIGWSSLLLRRDYRDYFLNEGVALYGYYWAGSSFRLEGGWRTEDQRSIPANDPWTLFRSDETWRPNPLIDDGQYHTVHLGFTYDTRNEAIQPNTGALVKVEWERSSSEDVAPVTLPSTIRSGIPTDGSYAYQRLWIDARAYNRLTPSTRVNARLVGGGWIGGDPLPLQQRLSLGGPGILPGYSFRWDRCGEGAPADAAMPALCDRSLALEAEFRSRLDLGLLYKYKDRSQVESAFGLGQVDAVIHADMGKSWISGDGPGRVPTGRIPNLDEWLYDVGAGVDAGGIGIYLSKALTGGQPVRFVLRLQRRF